MDFIRYLLQDMPMPYIARHDDVYGMGATAKEARASFENAAASTTRSTSSSA